MLAISLLGQTHITLDGELVTGFISAKAPALLAYLVVESERPYRRTALAGIFWPEQTDSVARKNLRDILFNLQKVLRNRDAEPPYLIVNRNDAQFNRGSAYRLDVEQFTALAAACETHRHKRREICPSCAARTEAAADLYRGDFLAGIHVGGSDVFENWQTLHRERLHQQALAGLYHLTRYHTRRREFAQARQVAQRQVTLAPWLESAYQQLMALFAWEGQRGAALAQYELCRQRLATELAVAPGPETTTLYEQIKAGITAGQEIATSLLPRPLNPRSNIPPQTTPFFGREQARRQLADFLQDPQRRLLTLVGPGGSGKTRLAVEAMTESLYVFEHGVFLAPLAGLDDPDQLPLTLAAALGLPLAGAKPPQTQLLNYLREKELLLVLDNFEGVLEDGRSPAALDLLIDILNHAPGVVLLVTSRQLLGLQAEQLLDLDGLDFPPAANEGDPAKFEAVQLFLDRARRVQPRLETNPDSLAAATAICCLTAGLPLGIELAAAWARTLPIPQILQAMKASLDTLATSRRDVPARHRSLRATFDYTWQRLPSDAQRAFSELSVFRGGFAAAATGVTDSVLDTLAARSLVQLDGNGRYQLHEMLRQFAAEKLREQPGRETAVHDRRCAWVADFLQQWGTPLKGGGQLEALRQIDAEIDNIRAGWQWAVSNRKEAEISRALGAVATYYDIRGWFQEGEAMFGRAAAAVEADSVLYGRLLAYQAGFNHRLGRYEQAQPLFEKCLALFEKRSALAETVFPLNGLAVIAMSRGQFAPAKQFAERGLAVAKEYGKQFEKSKSLDILGVVARHEGRLAEAKPLLQASLRIHELIGDQFGLARSYNHLGNCAVAENAFDDAFAFFTRAMEICREIDYRFILPYLLNSLGIVTGHLNKYAESQKYYRESLALFQELGDQFGEGMAFDNLGHISEKMGDDFTAAGYFRDAIRLGLAMESQALILDAVGGIAKVSAKSDNITEALELAGLVLRHPGCRVETKQNLESVLDICRLSLAEDRITAILSGGQEQSLTETAAAILTQPG